MLHTRYGISNQCWAKIFDVGLHSHDRHSDYLKCGLWANLESSQCRQVITQCYIYNVGPTSAMLIQQ